MSDISCSGVIKVSGITGVSGFVSGLGCNGD